MKKIKLSDILIGIIFTLLFIAIGVIASVNMRFIYYLDVKLLNIPATSGLEPKVILDNYNALIDYNSPFFQGDLIFPSLPSSPEALQHFVEVKDIFVSFYYIGAITLILSIIIVIRKAAKKDYSFLQVSAITVVVIPVIAAIAASLNFDATFVIFHKLFFRNDFWLFDPITDPVITILPDTFFLHALIIIIVTVLIGSLILLLFSRKYKRRGIRYRVK